MTVLFIFLAVMSLDEFHTKKSHQNPKRAKSEAVKSKKERLCNDQKDKR